MEFPLKVYPTVPTAAMLDSSEMLQLDFAASRVTVGITTPHAQNPHQGNAQHVLIEQLYLLYKLPYSLIRSDADTSHMHFFTFSVPGCQHRICARPELLLH